MLGIVDELRSLKELAINAANDTNTEQDREMLQKMFGQRIANINDIADTTTYNGKHLIDGTYRNSYSYPVTHTVYQSHTEDVISGYLESETEVTQTHREVTGYEATVATTTTNRVTTTTNVEIITTRAEEITETPASDDNDITEDGVYDLAGFSGTLKISAAHVKLINSAGGTLNEVYIEDNGLTDLWLENISITNAKDCVINFAGSDNTLHLIGTNQLAITYSSDDPTDLDTPAINAGFGDFKILGDASLNVSAYGDRYGSRKAGRGAAIGCGANSSCGNIIIGTGVNLNAKSVYGAAIGSGLSGTAGDIIIAADATVTAESNNASGIGIGFSTSMSNSKVGNITIYTGADVTARGGANYSGIGCDIYSGNMSTPGHGSGKCGNIKIYSGANITASSGGISGYGVGGFNCGDIEFPSNILDTANLISTGSGTWSVKNDTYRRTFKDDTVAPTEEKSIYPAAITNTSTSTATLAPVIEIGEPVTTTSAETYETSERVPTGRNTERSSNSAVATSSSTAETVDGNTTTTTTTNTTTTSVTDTTVTTNTTLRTNSTTTTETVKVPVSIPITDTVTVTTSYSYTDTGTVPAEPATFHVGARSGDSISIIFHDMHTKALHSDGADKTLDDVSLTTRENALEALDVINDALNYALDEATSIGALLRRLEFTVSNLVTTSENIQAADSAIRNADMAREMTNYTRANVLAASARTMLAQANQNSGNVLGLLQ